MPRNATQQCARSWAFSCMLTGVSGHAHGLFGPCRRAVNPRVFASYFTIFFFPFTMYTPFGKSTEDESWPTTRPRRSYMVSEDLPLALPLLTK